MFHFKFVALLITFSAISSIVEVKTVNKVIVLSPQNHSSALKRLEVNILENFGRKLKLTINYIATNDSLNFVFNSETRFEQFSNSTEYL